MALWKYIYAINGFIITCNQQIVIIWSWHTWYGKSNYILKLFKEWLSFVIILLITDWRQI